MTLFLDLDGVLADFDTGAQRLIGTDNTYKWEWIHGSTAFWDILNADPEFFFKLPMMEDARYLWENVAHLSPTILTALPKSGAQAVERQKRAWVAENLGVDVPVICCLTHEKPNYCNPGDWLVDDRSVNRNRWTDRGGAFVLHQDAIRTIATIERYYGK